VASLTGAAAELIAVDGKTVRRSYQKKGRVRTRRREMSETGATGRSSFRRKRAISTKASAPASTASRHNSNTFLNHFKDLPDLRQLGKSPLSRTSSPDCPAQRGFTIHEALRLCYGSPDSGDAAHSPERQRRCCPISRS
jgi:hypothetical protein